MSFNITLEGGTSLRLPTAGKYCDRDIIVTAEGGGSLSDFLLPVFLDPDTMTYSPSYDEIGACVQALLMGTPTKYPILLDLTGSPVGALAGIGKDDAWVFGMASAITDGADYYHYSQLKGYWLHIDGSAEPFGYFEMSTLDNPATGSDIVKGKSAYVLDEDNFRELLHGTYEPPEPEDLSDVLTEQDSLIDQIEQALIGKASGGGSESQIDIAALIDRTITEAVIPDGTTKIGSYVFCLCNKLVSVTLPSSLTNIDQQAFNGCTVLPSINIPDSVNNIGNYAFYNNQKLTSLTLPSGLKTLGANAFGNCKGLTAVTFRGTPTSVQATSFNLCTAVTDVYVPWASGAVANAPWGMTNATIHYNS